MGCFKAEQNEEAYVLLLTKWPLCGNKVDTNDDVCG